MEEIEMKDTPRWRLEITLRLDEMPIHSYFQSMLNIDSYSIYYLLGKLKEKYFCFKAFIYYPDLQFLF